MQDVESYDVMWNCGDEEREGRGKGGTGKVKGGGDLSQPRPTRSLPFPTPPSLNPVLPFP